MCIPNLSLNIILYLSNLLDYIYTLANMNHYCTSSTFCLSLSSYFCASYTVLSLRQNFTPSANSLWLLQISLTRAYFFHSYNRIIKIWILSQSYMHIHTLTPSHSTLLLIHTCHPMLCKYTNRYLINTKFLDWHMFFWICLTIFFSFLFFFWCWGWNSGLWAC
jgi:hypothetical protein